MMQGSDKDRALHVAQAKLSGGLAPEALGLALADWGLHIANQPSKRADLVKRALADMKAFWLQAMGLPQPPPHQDIHDHRFAHPTWNQPGYALIRDAYLRSENWWQEATTGIAGVTQQNQQMISFLTRQMIDAASPVNMPLLNPQIIEATKLSHGANIRQGLQNFRSDMAAAGNQPLQHRPGQDVAITPGAVIFRNHLIELIQYSPSTAIVRPEPILIVPAWIMKYYILDLSPENSLIRYLVASGHTVFCISWLNPQSKDRDLGLDDYRRDGVMAALDAVSAICSDAKIHALGYCLGGTLLSITAAALARDGDTRIASLTMLAAQTDFTEAGDLKVFISEPQLALLDDVMDEAGYLDGAKMGGSFAMLRANDMIWSRILHHYFLGETAHESDMASWDADTTRMPYRMHSEYLRKLYLHNDLAEGRLNIEGKPVIISQITAPCFIVSAETDWVAPWRSVHKFMLLNAGDITFILASGGHNGGIVSVPGAPHRHYRAMRRKPGEAYQSAEDFRATAKLTENSWWPALVEFLDLYSSRAASPPAMGNPKAGYKKLGAAPGKYVLQR